MSSMDTGCRYRALLAVELVAAATSAVLDAVEDANPPPADKDAEAAVDVFATFCCHGDEPPEDGAGGGRADDEYGAGAAATTGLENVGLALRPSSAKMSSDRFVEDGAGGGGPGFCAGAEASGGGDKAGRYVVELAPREGGDAGGGGDAGSAA